MSFDRDLARLVPGHPRALEKCASMDRSHFLEDDHRRFKGQRQVRPLNLRILISFHTCFKLRYEVNKVKHAQVNYHEHSFTDHEKLNTKKVINIRLLQALQNTRSTNFNCIYSVACPCYRYFVCVLFWDYRTSSVSLIFNLSKTLSTAEIMCLQSFVRAVLCCCTLNVTNKIHFTKV